MLMSKLWFNAHKPSIPVCRFGSFSINWKKFGKHDEILSLAALL